jgi:hypothetical protein
LKYQKNDLGDITEEDQDLEEDTVDDIPTEDDEPVQTDQQQVNIETITLGLNEATAIKSNHFKTDEISSTTQFLRTYQTPSVRSVSSTLSKKQSTQNLRSKKLFDKHREAIENSAEKLVEEFKTRPHFLLSMFKKLSKLSRNESAQQQLMILVDDLIEEQYFDEMEDCDDFEDFEEDHDVNLGVRTKFRGEMHSILQSFIAAMAIKNDQLVKDVEGEIVNHVNAVMYSTFSNLKTGADEAMQKINNNRKNLESVVRKYQRFGLEGCFGDLCDDLTDFMDSVVGF